MEPSRRNQCKHRQIGRPPQPLKQAKFVAVGCDPLPEPSNGKEGVDGSSPSEGLILFPAQRRFPLAGLLQDRAVCSDMESVWKGAREGAR
jgi:hypothetical protein